MKQQDIRQIPLTAFLAVAGVLLPQFFHLFGLGPVFLPMFLPVMLGGLLLTLRFALLLAVITPAISWAFTGMPPVVPPVLPMVMVELLVINAILSILYVRLKWNVWLSLVLAILVDRLLLLLMVWIIAPLFGWQHPLFSLALVTSGLPGVILQLIVLPLTIGFVRERWKLLEE